MTPSPSGGTPLEAAARAMHMWFEGCKGVANPSCEACQDAARAALTAAIDALPPERIADLRYDMEHYEGVASLRRALGLEGDQG